MTVHFIGAGPGAADLLTLRAVALLGSSPVCVYAGTYVTAEILAHCPPDAVLVDSRRLDLDQITEHLVRAHAAGQDVARLCSGDPSLYSALTEQTRRLDAAGVPWDVTPGVPAYAAAAALLGQELTVPEVAQTVILTRTQAVSTQMPPGESLALLARSRATLVLHLAIRRTRQLATELAASYGPDCPVAVVANATAPGQLILRGTLADIADQVEAADLRQAAVIMVGEALRSTTREDLVESHLYGPRSRADDPESGSPDGEPTEPIVVIRAMLDRIQARDWPGTAALLHPAIVVEWPVTAETFRGADNFVAVQSEYPEGWSIHVLRLIADGPFVMSEIEVPHLGVGLFRAVSVWEVVDGLVVAGREYWSSPGSEAPPEWRHRLSS